MCVLFSCDRSPTVYHTPAAISTFFQKSLDKRDRREYDEHMNNHSNIQLKGEPMEDRYNVECCDFIHAHGELVERVRKTMPGEDTLYDLTELFRIFGDSTRIRILYVLFESEMCVCDIASLLGMTQSAISHQLRALKNARLVKSRREGKTVFYSLADDHVKTIIDQGLEHVSE